MAHASSAAVAATPPRARIHTVLERSVDDIRCSVVELDESAPRHQIGHERLSFWVPLNGRTLMYCERSRPPYEFQGGSSVTMTPGGSVWEGAWNGGGQTCVLLEIGEGVLREFTRDTIVYPNRGRLILKQDERIRYGVLTLHQDLLAPTSASDLFTGHIARGIALHYLSQYCSTREHPDDATRGLPAADMRRVLELIESRLGGKLTLAELAAQANLGVPTFCRRFKAGTGLSPYQFLLQAKVERAKTALAKADCSLSDLALSLGFYDQSQFTNTFKKIAGVCPSEFRKRKAS